METDAISLGEQTFDIVYQTLRELNWPDLEAVITSYKQRQIIPPYGDMLPILSAIASRGDGRKAIPLAAAWLLYNQASNLFDDLQDQDNKPLIWNEWEPARAMQVGLGLIAAAQLCLAKLQTDREGWADILHAYGSTLGLAAREQAATLAVSELPAYFRHVVGKSGLIYATVAWSGVRVHTEDQKALEAMRQYGLSLGMLLQLRDDYRDLHNGQLRSDLAVNPYTLPVLYALTRQEHPRQVELASLLKRPATPDVIADILGILDDLDAFSYCLAMMKAYEQKALDALQTFPAERVAPLEAYVSSFLIGTGSPD
jgi:geranylgeranyl pyrophosphate synthase